MNLGRQGKLGDVQHVHTALLGQMLATHTRRKALCGGLGGQTREHMLHPQLLEPKSGEGRCLWMKWAHWNKLQKLAEQASEKQCSLQASWTEQG